jgi:hypothetical protein
MTTGRELLDDLWRRLAGLDLPEGIEGMTRTQLLQETWSARFERLMRNRLLVGAYRYGKFGPKQAAAYNMVPSIKKRLDTFEHDGNLEHLVDVANLCMLIFVHGESVGLSMLAQDDSEHTQLK